MTQYFTLLVQWRRSCILIPSNSQRDNFSKAYRPYTKVYNFQVLLHSLKLLLPIPHTRSQRQHLAQQFLANPHLLAFHLFVAQTVNFAHLCSKKLTLGRETPYFMNIWPTLLEFAQRCFSKIELKALQHIPDSVHDAHLSLCKRFSLVHSFEQESTCNEA